MVSAIFWSKDVADSGVYGLLCVFMLPVCPYCVWQRFLYDVAVFMAVYAWAVLLCIVVACVKVCYKRPPWEVQGNLNTDNLPNPLFTLLPSGHRYSNLRWKSFVPSASIALASTNVTTQNHRER